MEDHSLSSVVSNLLQLFCVFASSTIFFYLSLFSISLLHSIIPILLYLLLHGPVTEPAVFLLLQFHLDSVWRDIFPSVYITISTYSLHLYYLHCLHLLIFLLFSNSSTYGIRLFLVFLSREYFPFEDV